MILFCKLLIVKRKFVSTCEFNKLKIIIMKKKKSLELVGEKLTKDQLSEIAGGMNWQGRKQSTHFEDRRGKSLKLPLSTGQMCNGALVYSDTWV